MHLGNFQPISFFQLFCLFDPLEIKINAFIRECVEIALLTECGEFILSFSLIFLEQRVETERTLTDAQRDEFEDMLRALTLERIQIKEAMGFALDNADAAGEVS